MSESDFVEKFLRQFKNIQETFLDYLENEINVDENFQNLCKILEDTKIRDCKHEVRLFLHHLLKVVNNIHRGPNFFSKIDRILQYFKDELKKYDSKEIFQLFKGNKRILLLLIEENILTVDEYFVKQITNGKYLSKKYPQYFLPEIEPFIDEKSFLQYEIREQEEYDKEEENENSSNEKVKKKLPDHFYEKRKIGENSSYMCKLIREDLIKDFTEYVSKRNIECNAIIPQSIYETNPFLIKKQNEVTLIEYAAFFGSIKITHFLINKGAKITPSLWLDAIHSRNTKLIHLLESIHVEQTVTVIKNEQKVEEKLWKECFKESIKCHHNEIINYFLNNYMQSEDENSSESIIQSLEYYNFSLLGKEHINKSSFIYLCHYDYYSLVNYLLTIENIDINSKTIQIHIFL